MYLEDVTGTYDANDNPGGYGTPNQDRSELAIYITGHIKKSTGDERVEFVAYDPTAASHFEALPLLMDGFFLICIACRNMHHQQTYNNIK